MTFLDPISGFGGLLRQTFGPLDWLPIADGQLHRFHVPGDRAGSRNGWYCLHLDGLPAGAFGSWKSGAVHRWSSREPANPVEAEQQRQRIEQARQQRDAERQQQQTATALQAVEQWQQAAPADPHHPYLIAKGVHPHNLRQLGSTLLVPLLHGGQLVNLQRIGSHGGKWFLPGGRVTGCHSLIGTPTAGKPLYLCEGWATGATIHEATGCPVACAMNAGNLLAAGRQLRQLYPAAELVVAGDDDRATEAAGKGNPGRAAASHAAAMLGCEVCFPAWPANAPSHLTDFNDLTNWEATHVPA